MARLTIVPLTVFPALRTCESAADAYNVAPMKFIVPRLLACACALAAQFVLAADTPTNAPAAKPAVPNAPTATSTNAGARMLAMRSELREINAKLRDLQLQCTNAPAVQAIVAEYESTRQELQSINKKLQETQQRLQDAMAAEVVKKDPSAKQLIDRRQELMNEIKATHPPMNTTPRTGASHPHPSVPHAAPPAPAAPVEKK